MMILTPSLSSYNIINNYYNLLMIRTTQNWSVDFSLINDQLLAQAGQTLSGMIHACIIIDVAGRYHLLLLPAVARHQSPLLTPCSHHDEDGSVKTERINTNWFCPNVKNRQIAQFHNFSLRQLCSSSFYVDRWSRANASALVCFMTILHWVSNVRGPIPWTILNDQFWLSRKRGGPFN